MSETPRLFVHRRRPYNGPFSDIQSRRVIYGTLQLPESAEEEIRERKKRRQWLDRVVSKTDSLTEFSREWSERKDARAELNEMYEERGLVPSAELFVVDGLEGKSPYEILGVPEGDMVEAHRAWRSLMLVYHPDAIRHQIENTIQEMMKAPGMELGKIALRTQAEDEKTLYPGKSLSGKQLARLGPKKRAAYEARNRAWHEKKLPSESLLYLRRELEEKAEKKAKLINLAWQAIKQGLSYENIVGLNSLWTTTEGEQHGHYGFWLSPRQKIILQEDAELERDLSFHVSDEGELVLEKAGPTRLSFLWGPDNHYGTYEMYRSDINLKSLFAFLEHRDGKRISPILLSDIAEKYSLSRSQIEELRELIFNKASFTNICKKLGIRPLLEPIPHTGKFVPDIKVDHEISGLDEENKKSLLKDYATKVVEKVERFAQERVRFHTDAYRATCNAHIFSGAKSQGITFAEAYAKVDKSFSIDINEKRSYIWHAVMDDLREIQKIRVHFKKDLEEILKGPVYVPYYFDYGGSSEAYGAGVEFGRDGLRIILPKRENVGYGVKYDFAKVNEAFFNREDLAVMREIAYGRSLAAKTTENKISYTEQT